MINFKIGTQIENELADFHNTKVRLAAIQDQNQTVRYGKAEPQGYFFNQEQTLSVIDLYYNSKFTRGPIDKNGQRKIFLNIGKFRCEVSSKQIDLDTKDGKFVPTDYADPWASIFMQKDFKEWAKDSYFGELLNECVQNFPKYGTIVLKKVNKDVTNVPLQNLKNEQTADSLATAKYVIEEHPKMTPWEIDEMPNWNTEGLTLKFDQTMDVYERYGFVPLKWLKEINRQTPSEGDELIYVDSLVITGKNPAASAQNPWHTFYASKITERPYREAHWSKQHGRWLGIGVMEDLIENQEAKNIIVNLIRRRFHWSAKVVGMTQSESVTAKNLVKDVKDGEILEVGTNGDIKLLDFASRNGPEFQQFLNEFETNSDQKAFTYEVATGESLPSGTPFRLGVVLSSATNTFFDGKRERLGLLLSRAVNDFLVPQFLKDMQNEDKVLRMFSSEAGFEVVQEAVMDLVKEEATKISLLSGKKVDPAVLAQAVSPFEGAKVLLFNRSADYYKNLPSSFTFEFTDESEDVQSTMETLKSLYQVMIQAGDPRAEKVLERIAALSGESMAQFGPLPTPQPTASPPQQLAPAPQPTAPPANV